MRLKCSVKTNPSCHIIFWVYVSFWPWHSQCECQYRGEFYGARSKGGLSLSISHLILKDWIAVWETGVFRHHRATIEGPSKTIRTVTVLSFSRVLHGAFNLFLIMSRDTNLWHWHCFQSGSFDISHLFSTLHSKNYKLSSWQGCICSVVSDKNTE